MTTSGSFSFNPTLTRQVTLAYRDCNIINDTEQPTPEQYTDAVDRLNQIVKGMEATGLHVWTEEEAIVFLQPNQKRYTFGAPTGNDVSCDADAWTQGALAQTAGPGAGQVQVQSALGIASTDNIGIVLDTGSIFWTTVAGAPVGQTVTLAAALPSQASGGAVVADFPTTAGPISRPLKVPRWAQYQYAGQIETPMTVTSRQRFMDLPNKAAQGPSTQMYYSPQVDRGLMYFWPVAISATIAARFTWYRPISDFLNPADTMDFPQEWAPGMRWLLADDLKVTYGVSAERATRIEKKLAEWLTTLSGYDRDSEPVEFGMDFTRR